MWILFYIEFSFSLGTLDFLLMTFVLNTSLQPQVNLLRASKHFTSSSFFRKVVIGCTQAELRIELQNDVLKGEEYCSGYVIFRQDRGPHKSEGRRDRCLH